jgi:hypothetical protein
MFGEGYLAIAPEPSRLKPVLRDCETFDTPCYNHIPAHLPPKAIGLYTECKSFALCRSFFWAPGALNPLDAGFRHDSYAIGNR